MMKKYRNIKILVILLILFQISFATAPKVGTSAAAQLLIPMGARNVAMGGADISDIDGPEAIYWNPAGLANVGTASATFNYLNYFADMKVSYLAAGMNAGRAGVIGLSVQTLDFGSWEKTTVWQPEGTGEMIEPNFMTFGLTYAKRFTDRILFGANAKIIQENVESMSASGFGFDLGIQYVTPFGLSFGVTMKNVGSKMKYDGTDIEFDSEIDYADPNATTRITRLVMADSDLPASLNLGLGYNYEVNEMADINLAGTFANEAYGLQKLHFGGEAILKDMIALRGGYIYNIYPDDYPFEENSEYGFSFGAGINVNLGGTDFMIDYAYRPMETFDANQYFSISFGM